jgi:uncharacterized protein (DUF849 family)
MKAHSKETIDRNTVTYFVEKSTAMIRKLVTGKGDAISRLREVETEICFLLAFDVPPHLEKLKHEIQKYVFKYEEFSINGLIKRTSFQNSIATIRNSTASKIIDCLYTLHTEMTIFRDNIKN